MLIDPRHLAAIGGLLTAGAVAAAAMTTTVDRRRMADLRSQLMVLDTMTLEPERKAEVRSSLAYHLAGLERSAAQRLTLRAPYIPVFGVGVVSLVAAGALVARRRLSRATRGPA